MVLAFWNLGYSLFCAIRFLRHKKDLIALKSHNLVMASFGIIFSLVAVAIVAVTSYQTNEEMKALYEYITLITCLPAGVYCSLEGVDDLLFRVAFVIIEFLIGSAYGSIVAYSVNNRCNILSIMNVLFVVTHLGPHGIIIVTGLRDICGNINA